MPQLALRGGTPVRSKPFPSWPVWDEEDAAAVAGVVRSGKWGIPRGGHVDAFEERFAAFHNASFGIAVPSGTAALDVALRACGVGLGDEVISSPYTFIATASAIFHVGAVPVFADIDPETYNLDPQQIASAITPHTKALMPVHVAGCPADLDAVLALARQRGLRVIEDASQAHGARWCGPCTGDEPRGVGAIGDCGTFSFQSTKNLNCGEGGVVLTQDEEIFRRAYAFHFVGGLKGGERPELPVLGTNKRMTEFQGALLLSQMRRLPEQIQRREENAAYLTAELRKLGLEAQARDARNHTHAWHLFTIRYRPEAFAGAPRDRFLEALQAEGVPGSSGYRPLYRDRVWQTDDHVQRVLRHHPRPIDFAAINLPVCERVCREEAIWLTQNLLLGDRGDMNSIVEAVGKIQQAAGEL